MNNKSELDELAELEEKFSQMYWDYGLVGIHPGEIQLTEEYFREIFEGEDWEYRPACTETGNDRLVKEYNGSFFFCVINLGDDNGNE